MGLPGVQQRALDQLSKSYDQRSFALSDIYIDGINYAQRIVPRGLERRIQNAEQYGLYEQASLIAEVEIQKLKNLHPHKITAVFDAMISEEKFAVRMSRANTRLTKGIVPMNVSEILAERIANHHKDIKIIYSGAEAEDEIMKLIDEDHSRGQRHQLVFSSDSDIYRFNIRNANTVEIIPHMRQSLNTGTKIRTVPLRLANSLVNKDDRIYAPILRPGVSVEDPKISSRKLHEFINCGNVHKHFFISHGPMLIKDSAKAPMNLCPFDAGTRIRRAAYGLIIDKHFHGRPEVRTDSVVEWLQYDYKMMPTSVEPIHGELQQKVLTEIRDSPIEYIIRTEIAKVSAKYDIAEQELLNISRAAAQVYSGEAQEETLPISDRTNQLYLLFKAVVKSVLFLNEVADTKPNIVEIDRYLKPAHLQTFLRN